MKFSAKVLCDSISKKGDRLITLEATYPRIIHSELMTHRLFSRNSASSRAIPVKKMLEQIRDNPFVPIHWGKSQSGMQAYEEVDEDIKLICEKEWIAARDAALNKAELLSKLNIHKQIVNRIVEPYMWITVIISSTNWSNFFKLRCNPEAEPHIQKIAYLMRDAIEKSKPNLITNGFWHLPLIKNDDPDMDLETKKMVSVARCARVSYLTHDGKRDIDKDIELYNRLKNSGHYSPFEHVAMPSENLEDFANFFGWKQLRREIIGECG